MSRGAGRILLALAAASVPVLHGPTASASAPSSSAQVTYVTGATVYVSAGERDGVTAGTRLSVEVEARPAVLLAYETAPRRAACRVVEGEIASVRVGDPVRYESASTPASGTTAEATTPSAPWGIRGRVGVRYLATRNGLNGDQDFQQPAADLRLDGPSLRGTPWGFRADARARRTLRASGNDDGRTRVYALQGWWDSPGPGWRFALGRQSSPDLATVSLFDGASATYDRPRWSAGAFAGTEPDAADFGYSNDVREYGSFAAWRSAPSSRRRWSLGGGAVASYDRSEINREYLFLRGAYDGPRTAGFLTQEVDVNRGWKKDAGESSLEPTSTFASLRVRAASWFDFLAGYDDRRNVRLYRDYVSPETDFDDAFRRGIWLGANARMGDHFTAGFSGRNNSGGDAGSAKSYTATFGAARLTSFGLAVHARATRYESDRLHGGLFAADVALDLGSHVRMDVEGGMRSDESELNSALDDDVVWFGASVDVDLGRSLWGTLTLDRSKGDFEDVDQLYVTLAYRF